jgi:hypothetical protein
MHPMRDMFIYLYYVSLIASRSPEGISPVFRVHVTTIAPILIIPVGTN